MTSAGRYGTSHTWHGNPVTAGSALAAAFEGVTVQLTVDDVLETPQQHAEEEGCRNQAEVGAEPSSLQNHTKWTVDVKGTEAKRYVAHAT